MKKEHVWNSKLKLYRRINILVYLNKDWRADFGGQIELAGKNANGEFDTLVALEPIFNRTLIFVTDDSSFHGQPNPVNHPQNNRRNSKQRTTPPPISRQEPRM